MIADSSCQNILLNRAITSSSIYIGALVALILSLFITTQSAAQDTRAAISEKLGTAVNIEEAALFAASFATFK